MEIIQKLLCEMQMQWQTHQAAASLTYFQNADSEYNV